MERQAGVVLCGQQEACPEYRETGGSRERPGKNAAENRSDRRKNRPRAVMVLAWNEDMFRCPSGGEAFGMFLSRRGGPAAMENFLLKERVRSFFYGVRRRAEPSARCGRRRRGLGEEAVPLGGTLRESGKHREEASLFLEKEMTVRSRSVAVPCLREARFAQWRHSAEGKKKSRNTCLQDLEWRSGWDLNPRPPA